jgi:hypothetical protein
MLEELHQNVHIAVDVKHASNTRVNYTSAQCYAGWVISLHSHHWTCSCCCCLR